MSTQSRGLWSHSHGVAFMLGLLLVAPTLGFGQERQNPYGEWRYQSADAYGTRYTPVDQIDASNFADLEVASGVGASGPLVEEADHHGAETAGRRSGEVDREIGVPLARLLLHPDDEGLAAGR